MVRLDVSNIYQIASYSYNNRQAVHFVYRAVFFLFLVAVFSPVLLPPIDATADASWREKRISAIEKELKRNKLRYSNLAHRQEQYLTTRVTNVEKRTARFSTLALARTIRYNQDVAAIDREMDEDYQQWQARTGKASHWEWRETARAKDLMAVAWRKKIALRVAYKADMKKLKKEVLQGEDGILEAMDNERDALLAERRSLVAELDFLTSHTDDEVEGDKDEAPWDWLDVRDFSISVVGKKVRYVKVGDTVEVELLVGAGKMPLTLDIVAEDGSRQSRTLKKFGKLKIPFHFTEAGNQTRLFMLTDSGLPIRWRTDNVLFIVQGDGRDVVKSRTVSDSQGPHVEVKSHNQTIPWSTVSSPDITLTGTATDKNRGNNGISGVYVNHSLADSGSAASGNGSADWSESITLSSGWNKIIIDAYDDSPGKNKAQKAIWIFYQSPDTPELPIPPGTGPDQAPPVLSAELDCGDSFELAPGDFVGRSCGIVVRGWQHSDQRVSVTVEYDRNSGIEVVPGNDSQHPMNMFNPGVSDYYDRYIFSETFRAKENAAPGVTTVVITVSQVGAGEVTLTLTIAVLETGLQPSSGPGIRPTAEVVTGSGGDFCVWRHKSFGDPPECFNFSRARCDHTRYTDPKYELVGSAMTWREAGARMAQLGSYHEDAYGCHSSDSEEQEGSDELIPDRRPDRPANQSSEPGETGNSQGQKGGDVVKQYYLITVTGSGYIPHYAGGSFIKTGHKDIPVIIDSTQGGTFAQAFAKIRATWEAPPNCSNVISDRIPLSEGPPRFWEKGPDVKKMAGPLTKAEFDTRTVTEEWKLAGSDGPGFGELLKRFCGGKGDKPDGKNGQPGQPVTPGVQDSAGQGSTAKDQSTPDSFDPNNQDVSRLIREWLAIAEPPENATEGANFHYDSWGRKIGVTADGAVITAGGPPDYALSTPEETAWSQRKQLDSVNHCTLGEYVVAKLANQSIEYCRGRYTGSDGKKTDNHSKPGRDDIKAKPDRMSPTKPIAKAGGSAGFNPLSDPGMGLHPSSSEQITKVEEKVKEYVSQGPTGRIPEKDSGSLGDSSEPIVQPESYVSGKIGINKTPSDHKSDKKKTTGAGNTSQNTDKSPGTSGTGGLSGITVDSKDITITVWDHAAEDGDIINIYLNGEKIRTDVRLTNAKQKIRLSLRSGTNVFEMEAVNEGRQSPNTAVMEISNVSVGKKKQSSSLKKGEKAKMEIQISN